ncbi:MAG: VanZ family protein [Chloroflexota bacterium]
MRIDRLALLLLLAYLLLLAVLTLRPVGADVDSNLRFNLKPFATIGPALQHGPGSRIFATLVGNLVAFMPLGLLLPLAFRRINWLGVIAAGLVLSVAIESAQLGLSLYLGFGYRAADVDDVIVNVAGTVVGLALFGVAAITTSLFRRGRSAG